MAYQYPSKDEILAEARKIPPLAWRKMKEETESYKEAYEQQYGEGSLNDLETSPRELAEWMDSQEHAYDWIVGAFENFTEPDIKALEGLTESMRTAEKAFEGGGLGWIDTAKGYMGDGGWDGALSTNFVNNFLTPMSGPQSIPDNQLKIATVLRQQMEANEAIFAATRTDALNLAKRTITALEAVGDKSGDDTALGLAVAGAVISVAGVALAPVTGGMSIAAGLAVNLTIETVKGAIAVGDKFVPKDGDIPIGADTVNGVIRNMADAMTKMYETISTEEDKIVATLNTNYNNITTLRAAANSSGLSSPVMPLRPKLNGSMNDGGALTNGLD